MSWPDALERALDYGILFTVFGPLLGGIYLIARAVVSTFRGY